jgi:hypothetical protein
VTRWLLHKRDERPTRRYVPTANQPTEDPSGQHSDTALTLTVATDRGPAIIRSGIFPQPRFVVCSLSNTSIRTLAHRPCTACHLRLVARNSPERECVRSFDEIPPASTTIRPR